MKTKNKKISKYSGNENEADKTAIGSSGSQSGEAGG